MYFRGNRGCEVDNLPVHVSVLIVDKQPTYPGGVAKI